MYMYPPCNCLTILKMWYFPALILLYLVNIESSASTPRLPWTCIFSVCIAIMFGMHHARSRRIYNVPSGAFFYWILEEDKINPIKQDVDLSAWEEENINAVGWKGLHFQSKLLLVFLFWVSQDLRAGAGRRKSVMKRSIHLARRWGSI